MGSPHIEFDHKNLEEIRQKLALIDRRIHRLCVGDKVIIITRKKWDKEKRYKAEITAKYRYYMRVRIQNKLCDTSINYNQLRCGEIQFKRVG